jgi:hypothetical protein
MRQRTVIVPEFKQQAPQFIQRRHHQIGRGMRVCRQPGPDFGDAPMAFRHAASVHAGGRVRVRAFLRGQNRLHGTRRAALGENIDAAAPGPEVGRPSGRQRDGFGIEPEHQTCRRAGGQTLSAHVEFIPALRIKPAVRTEDMHHVSRSGLPDQPLLQRRDVHNLSPQRQSAGPQPCPDQDLVERRQDLLAQPLVGSVDQQPLERRAVNQRTDESLKVVETRGRQRMRLLQPKTLKFKTGLGHRVTCPAMRQAVAGGAVFAGCAAFASA